MKLARVEFGLALAGAILLTTSVANADGYQPRGPQYAAPAFSWTGFYVGLNAGYGWNNNSVEHHGESTEGAGNYLLNRIFVPGSNIGAPSSRSHSLESSGFFGGGQLGHNWRIGRHWVTGFEIDLQSSRIQGDAAKTGELIAGEPLTIKSAQDSVWFGTVRGRLGFLANERLLVFGTAGFAYGRTEVSSNITNGGGVTGVTTPGGTQYHDCTTGSVCFSGEDAKISTGWTAGGGFEWVLSNTTTLKAEYLHVDLGDQSILMPTRLPATGNAYLGAKFNNSFDIVRTGINVNF
jgi:outer membrane immunogenic protein